MRGGIFEHPDWYSNLTVLSSFEEVQKELHQKGETNCAMPCQTVDDSITAPVASVPQLRSSKAVCNKALPYPPDGFPDTWFLPSREQDHCFDWLQQKNFVNQINRQKT